VASLLTVGSAGPGPAVGCRVRQWAVALLQGEEAAFWTGAAAYSANQQIELCLQTRDRRGVQCAACDGVRDETVDAMHRGGARSVKQASQGHTQGCDLARYGRLHRLRVRVWGERAAISSRKRVTGRVPLDANPHQHQGTSNWTKSQNSVS